MSVTSTLYKIKSDGVTEKIIARIKQFYLTLINLGQAEEILNFIIKSLGTFGKNDIILASLTVNAITTYVRCFNQGYGSTLSHSLFNDGTRPNAALNEISERDFHTLIMNYRNQHLAHSDILLTTIDVGACRLEGGVVAVGPLLGTRIPIEDVNFYKNLINLITKAKQHLQPQLQHAINELSTLIQNGDAEITNEALELTPISHDVKKMWGLD